MEGKKIKRENNSHRTLRKFFNGCLLFGAGFIAGSRIEILLQNKGISPTQCEFVSVGCPEKESTQTKAKAQTQTLANEKR